MKITRILIYEGDERTLLSGLGCRAVRGERILGNGVLCTETFFAGDWPVIDREAPAGSITKALREKIAALPEPTRDTAHGDPPTDPMLTGAEAKAFIQDLRGPHDPVDPA